MENIKIYELSTRYDERQSFGHKAIVHTDGKDSVLYSYETPVARITNGKVELSPSWDYGNTTVRHVREYLRQEGKLPTSIEGAEKKDIASLFPVVDF
jgi:hypothetical protein